MLIGDVDKIKSVIINVVMTALKKSSEGQISLIGYYNQIDQELKMQVEYKGRSIVKLPTFEDVFDKNQNDCAMKKRDQNLKLRVVGLLVSKQIVKAYKGALCSGSNGFKGNINFNMRLRQVLDPIYSPCTYV